MRIDILSVVPELLFSPFEHSIMRRAQDKGHFEVYIHDLKDYGLGKKRQVDDYQFGGGAGMVLRIEPIAACIRMLKKEREYDEVIFMTPDAPVLDQKMTNRLSLLNNIIILCGHYKGVDQRVRDTFVTAEISIGDFVLSGGELPAAVLVDAIGRLIPGVLNDESSALTDSHQDGLLAGPVYTRPASYEGMDVPQVLLSGHAQKIEEWRFDQSLKKTRNVRPDLLQEDDH